jgi:hypothetical protein
MSKAAARAEHPLVRSVLTQTGLGSRRAAIGLAIFVAGLFCSESSETGSANPLFTGGIVMFLLFACTAISLFDLYLLLSG